MTANKAPRRPGPSGASLSQDCRETATDAVGKQRRKRRTKAEIQHLLTSTHNYLGDYDEAGLDIPKVIQRNLKADHGVEVELIRAAITDEQIDAWNLPTRPPKGTKRGQTITRAVEVDVLRPSQIRAVVTDIIEDLVDTREIERMRLIEEEERRTLRGIALNLEGGPA